MTKIKICGIKSQIVVPVLNRLLPDYVGFVFAKSSRQVTFEQAAKLKSSLDPRIQTVAVVTEFMPDLFEKLAKKQIVENVQLHLPLTAQQLYWLQQLGLNVFQVIKPDWRRLFQAQYWMFDAKQPGSGKLADWNEIDTQQHPFILAGGLNPQNVAAAIQKLHPTVVDVSSGVETNGRKDPLKIKEFIRSVRNADKSN
jgi:phosphoribosylanthranilate isomerase